MDNPLVSIIVPCYNQSLYLSETLDSVINQTYNQWECIIVNDGSNDNSEEIAKSYCLKDSRVIYIAQPNQGVSTARNTAIMASKGKYILPLDGDDLIAPTYLEKAVVYLEHHSKTKLVYSRVKLFGIENGEWNLPEYNYEALLWGNMIVCTAMYRREDFDKTSGYNPNMQKGLEDWDFWLSLLKQIDKVYCIPEFLFFYRIKDVSRNQSITYETNKELNRTIVQNHRYIYEPYLGEIINFRTAEQRLQDAIDFKVNEIRNSLAYRLGNAILRPFSWLRKYGNRKR